jgi:putative heme-binding domain-containing protein
MRLSLQFRLLLLWVSTAAVLPCPAQEAPAPDPGTAALIDIIPQIDDAAAQLDILKGIRAGLAGQRQVVAPPNWGAIYRDHLAKSSSDEVRELARLLALQFGDQEVRRELLHVVGDERAPLSRRREALTALAEIRASELPGELHALLSGSALRTDALRVLAEFGSDQTPQAIIAAYDKLDLEERRIALDALSSGVESARRLLEAVQYEKIPRTDLGAETIRKLRLLNSPSIEEAIAKHWGTTRQTPEAKLERIAAIKAMLQVPADQEADLPRGRAIFAKTCRQCHKLFGDGENVGPEITGSNRADLDYLLLNIVDPNTTVGKDYQASSILTEAGKLLVGLVAGEDDRVLTLRTETDTLQIPKDEIVHRELTPVSMMPEGLLDQLSEADVRDLVAYLQSSQQVPLPSTEEVTVDAPSE